MQQNNSVRWLKPSIIDPKDRGRTLSKNACFSKHFSAFLDNPAQPELFLRPTARILHAHFERDPRHEKHHRPFVARPTTLLAQVRYVVPDIAIGSFLDMESDGLKAELQQSPAHPKGWRDAVLGIRQTAEPLGCLFGPLKRAKIRVPGLVYSVFGED